MVIGRLLKDQRRTLREMTPESRRAVYRQTALTYTVVGGYFALMIVHPFGLRNTFTYCLIIPILACVPLGTTHRRSAKPQRTQAASAPRTPSLSGAVSRIDAAKSANTPPRLTDATAEGLTFISKPRPLRRALGDGKDPQPTVAR